MIGYTINEKLSGIAVRPYMQNRAETQKALRIALKGEDTKQHCLAFGKGVNLKVLKWNSIPMNTLNFKIVTPSRPVGMKAYDYEGTKVPPPRRAPPGQEPHWDAQHRLWWNEWNHTAKAQHKHILAWSGRKEDMTCIACGLKASYSNGTNWRADDKVSTCKELNSQMLKRVANKMALDRAKEEGKTLDEINRERGIESGEPVDTPVLLTGGHQNEQAPEEPGEENQQEEWQEAASSEVEELEGPAEKVQCSMQGRRKSGTERQTEGWLSAEGEQTQDDTGSKAEDEEDAWAEVSQYIRTDVFDRREDEIAERQRAWDRWEQRESSTGLNARHVDVWSTDSE